MINQFKCHILCHLEGTIGAIFHAASSKLQKLDVILEFYLQFLNLDNKFNLLDFNMAPLKTRRNIAMLGFIHKVVLKEVHDDIIRLLPLANDVLDKRSRLQQQRHDKQLFDRCDGRQSTLLHNSIFGLVRIYNCLPQKAVDQTTVSAFQSYLTSMVKEWCKTHDNFADMFCPRTNPSVPLLTV